MYTSGHYSFDQKAALNKEVWKTNAVGGITEKSWINHVSDKRIAIVVYTVYSR